MRHGLSDDDIAAVTRFDPWFLARIREIVDEEARGRSRTACRATRPACAGSRCMGFSDARLAHLTGRAEASVRADRLHAGVVAVFKRIDTCGGEFEAQTPYMYSTYEADAERHRRMRGASLGTRARWSSSAAAPTASARASSSTIAAATPASR